MKKNGACRVGTYEIIVRDHVDRRRFSEFEKLDVTPMPDGTTRLSGALKDQAELFCVLSRIRDMNLKLESVVKGREVGEE